MSSFLPLPPAAAVLPLAGCVLLAAGCAEEVDPIRVYTVAAVESAPAPTAPVAPPRAPFAGRSMTGRSMTGVADVTEPQRLLGAIAERGGDFWFFKLIGPTEAVGAVEPAFGDWLRTVRFDGGGPAWDVPTGWEERPGGGMRFATLVPADGLEATVIKLPVRGDAAEQIDANFDRWRGQVGRTDGGTVEKVELADGTAAQLLSVSSPEAAGGAGSGAAAKPQAGVVPFEYEVPEGWEPAAASPMTQLAFTTGSDDDAAAVTVARFPAGSMTVEQVAGIWRGQAGAVGGTPPDEAAPLKIGETVPIRPVPPVPGVPNPDAPNAEVPRIALPPAEPGGTAVFGTAFERGGALWLVKLTGPEAAVDAARPAFGRFLESLTFPDTPAASNE